MGDAKADVQDRLAEILTQGCDDRIVVNPKTGMHKYNGTNRPVPGSVRRSSCTFSVPTDEMFAEGVTALERLEADKDEVPIMRQSICDRLIAVWKISPGAAITMFPSGTDAEFLPLLVGLSRAMKAGGKLASFIVCAGEVGSGTSDAAIGKHFSPLLPFQHQCPKHKVGGSIFAEGSVPEIDAIPLTLRNSAGERHAMADLDDIVKNAVAKALGEGGYAVVVVHIVAGSKTGSIMPSPDAVAALVKEYGDRVVPVVDACQTRMSDGGVHDLLEQGFAVLVTGSKFYGGPPFCGAALLPQTMVMELNESLGGGLPAFREAVASSSLGAYISGDLVAPELKVLKEMMPKDDPNLGLLLRWQMALFHIEQYHSISEIERDRIVHWWTDQFHEIVEEIASPAVSIIDDHSMEPVHKGIRRKKTMDAVNACHMLPAKTIFLLELKKFTGAGEGGVEQWERMSLDEMKKVHTLMATDISGKDGWPEDPILAKRIFLAQPVALSSDFVIIRAAIGAPLVDRVRLMLDARDDLGEIRREDEALIAKLHTLLRAWPSPK